ncbi:hypothetical protein [Nostoc sp. FACHB-110]|uniref:hypothetical protein n=1 Tax=Nostoc sp. FACHB-110 TaxID=2692834 RepID=UPI00168713A7|nr:hypothetical protein [Nostoc sp. FACHB-110]MBD2439546.1 hypothetical protein [Nostoc sp. FACHB-110]
MEESAVNPFGSGNPFPGNNGSLPQPPFANISDFVKYIPEGVSNPFTSPSTLPGGINPFASDGGSRFEQLIFGRLKGILGENFFDGSNKPFVNSGGNPFNLGTSPFNGNITPVGNSNKDFGVNNATIGNFNSIYGSESATIGNGNWNFSRNNTTIGNGNWKFGSNNTVIGNGNWAWDDGTDNSTLGNGNWQFGQKNQTVGNGNWNFGQDNTTVGNGNWHWDEGINNTTLGNGNWQFGISNKTLGNGNWDFGTNNIIIGNGNVVFGSGNIIIGNGIRLLEGNNTKIGVTNNDINFDSLLQNTESDVNSLINSLVGIFGKDFTKLTGNFNSSQTQTFDRLVLSRNIDGNNSNISNQLDQFFNKLFGGIPFDKLPYQPGDFQSVPEPSAAIPLIVFGFLFLLLSKFKLKILPKGKSATYSIYK